MVPTYGTHHDTRNPRRRNKHSKDWGNDRGRATKRVADPALVHLKVLISENFLLDEG
jgi:hypothetical protein